MKKRILAMMLVLVMALGLAACGNGGDGGEGGSKENAGGDKKDGGSGKTVEVDFSAYPEKLDDWTSEDMNRYFTEAGVYTEQEWVYTQDHENYYLGTIVDEGTGYMNDEGTVTICVFSFDVDNAELDVESVMEEIRSSKTLPEDLSSIPLDHMIGRYGFWYNNTVDEDVYNAMDAAVNALIEHFGGADF